MAHHRINRPIKACFRGPLHYAPFSVDLWADDQSFDREIGLVTDLELARVLYEATGCRFPDQVVTLRQVTRLLAKTGR